MKKTIYIMIFLMTILISSIYNVKALNLDNLPTLEEYEFVYLTMGNTTYTNMICAYTNGTVYCYKGNMSFAPRLFTNVNYVNENNSNGYFVTNQVWNWVGNNHSNYYSTSIMYWNSSNRHWYYYCNTGQNTCNNDIPVTNDYTITYYQAWDESDPYSNKPYNYNGSWVAVPEYQSPYYYGLAPSQISLLIDEDETSSRMYLEQHLYITLYDPNNEIGTGKVQYSFDNTNWEDTTLSSNGDEYDLQVYTNGTIYFRILNTNNTEIYTTTYSVTDLPTITGYQIYVIPSGNHNVYISNFSSTSGTLYIPPGFGSLTNSFVYLSSNGDITGIQEIYYNSYDENAWIPAYQMNKPSSTLISIDYDFTNFNNTKVLSFNYNNDKDLVFYIPNGLYVNYVDLSDNSNYDCGSEMNIDNTVRLQTCYVEYKYKDNNTIIDTSDKSNNRMDLNGYQDGNLSSQDYFSDIEKVIEYNKPVILGVTQDFTNFFNHLATPIKMSFFFCFGIVFVVLICKSFKF